MERVMVNEILLFLCNNNLISRHQHGFLKKLSTCTNLLETVNDWTVMLERGSKVAVAYIDFTRAFDSVCHSKLLHKLKSYGISGGLLEFIEFYLSNRLHCTRVGTQLSSSAAIKSGVIQGSCIGPILFVLFINDIVDKLNSNTYCKLFADDVKLYASINIGISSLQDSLNALYSWALEWQLDISILKCYIIILNRNNRSIFDYNIRFTLGDAILPYKSVVRDLGVFVDSQLNFNNHIAIITSKAHQRASLIFRCFVSKDPNLLIKERGNRGCVV